MSRWTFVGPSCSAPFSTFGDSGQLQVARHGPTYSGRCGAIAFDPVDATRIWAGSPTGGLRRSDDGGRTWRPVVHPGANLSIGTLAVDRQSRVYVGSGTAFGLGFNLLGAGLSFSDDSGATWTHQEAPFGTHSIRSIVVDPTNDAHVYVVSEAGLFESTNRAATWTTIDTGLTGVGEAAVLDPVDGPATQRLYVAYSKALLRRTSSGQEDVLATATGVEPFDTFHFIVALALSAARVRRTDGVEERLLYMLVGHTFGGFRGLYVSDDAGATWTKHGLPQLERPRHMHALAVHPTRPEIVFFGNVDMFRSRNRGGTWYQVAKGANSPPVHVDQLVFAFSPHDGRLWAGNDGGIWVRTHDNDENEDADEIWSARSRGFQGMQIYTLAQHPVADNALFIGTQDNAGQRSSGHPAFYEVEGGDGLGVAIESTPGADGVRAWYYSTQAHVDKPFRRSLAAGLPRAPDDPETGESRKSWEPLVKDLEFESGGFIVQLEPDPARPLHVFIAARGIFMTRNGGEDWEAVFRTSNEVTALGPASTSARLRVYAGFEVTCPEDMTCVDGDSVSEMVRRFEYDSTTDSWPRADTVGGPLLQFREWYAKDRVSAIAVVPSADGDHDRVYVAIGAFPDRKGAHPVATPVWRSDNSGVTWVPASAGLAPDNFVNCLVLDRAVPDRIYAGCDAGVFRSDDAGVSWQPFSEGLPNVQVFDLQLHPATAMLRAATHGWAVWERSVSATAPAIASSDARLLLRDAAAVSRPNPDPLPAIPPFEDDLWRRGADLKVEIRNDNGKFSRPRSTVDHERDGPADHLAFESFDDDTPDARSSVRVHLQIHNRGPAIARGVRARVFVAGKSAGGFPDLDPDFWSAFGQDRTSAGPWRPIGDTITIGEILPGEPAVATWMWTVPDDAPKNAGLFAVVTSPDDTNDEIELSIASVARFNEKALLKEIRIDNQISWARRHWKEIAVVAGLVVVAGIGVGAALALDDD